MSSEQKIIFVIEPYEAIREGLDSLLSGLGVKVRCFQDAEEFLNSNTTLSQTQHCLLVEADLPQLDCFNLLRLIRKRGDTLPIIVFVSTSNQQIIEQALKAGASCTINKPLINGKLLHYIQQFLHLEPIDNSKPPKNHIEIPQNITLHDKQITLRYIRAEDAEIEQDFVRKLSPLSKHLRFFSGIKQLSPDMLNQFTHPSYPSSCGLIATTIVAGKDTEIAVARYVSTDIDGVGEFAVVVADDWRKLGVAHILLNKLFEIAEKAGLKRLEGGVLRENISMLRLAQKLGMTTKSEVDDFTTLRVIKTLGLETQQNQKP